MNLYQPIISGSLEVSGSVTINGTLRVLSGSVTGTASLAENSLLLGGLDSGSFQSTSSFSSFSGSLSTRLVTDEANIATNTAASASFAAQSASLSTRLTTDESNFTSLSSSFATTSGSVAGRVTTIESKYATTGSNTFSNLQYISSSTNAQGFTTTASLYTDGGLRVSKDSYVSGTAYFNNVVVYGTSSIQYLTSSQVNVGANIINLNTQTPAVRFGGMAVADSGSNAGITGSMLWDSVNNRWVYSNPSGSTYDGGMIISGPRNTTGLGNEVGTTACYLMAGQGGDHITSSAIYSDTNATCFYGNTVITGSGAVCSTMINASCIGIGTTTPAYTLDVNGTGRFSSSTYLATTTSGAAVVIGGTSATYAQAGRGNLEMNGTSDNIFVQKSNGTLQMYLYSVSSGTNELWSSNTLAINSTAGNVTLNTGGTARLTIANSTGAATFSAATGGAITLTANGTANNWTSAITGNSTTSQSYGLLIQAGTNSTDAALRIRNQANSLDWLYIRGDGNVGIGTICPGNPLTIVNSASSMITVNSTDANGGYMRFQRSGTDFGWLGSAYHLTTPAGANTDLAVASSGNLLFNTGASLNERMRITSAGDVEVKGGAIRANGGYFRLSNSAGTTAYGYFLPKALWLGTGTDQSPSMAAEGGYGLSFFTNGTTAERMTITTGGNVFVGGTTSSAVRFGTFACTNTSSSYSFVAWNNSGNDILSARGDGLVTFPYVVSTWTTSNAANTWLNPASGDLYRSTSSLKYKKNVQNYTKGLTEVMQLRPVTYQGKHEVDRDRQFAGLIAEEVHDLGLTEFVQYADDGSPDALAYQNMVALLVKGMQEQQCIINTLKTCLGII